MQQQLLWGRILITIHTCTWHNPLIFTCPFKVDMAASAASFEEKETNA